VALRGRFGWDRGHYDSLELDEARAVVDAIDKALAEKEPDFSLSTRMAILALRDQTDAAIRAFDATHARRMAVRLQHLYTESEADLMSKSELDIDTAREALLEKRRRILVRYKGELAEAEELLSTVEPGRQDLSAIQRDASLVNSLGDADAHQLRAIIAALSRIEDGEYGTCTSCGRPITRQRLAALPETSLCVSCAADNEDRAALR
jgi:RNA polymerase-binding transcription factor DksA